MDARRLLAATPSTGVIGVSKTGDHGDGDARQFANVDRHDYRFQAHYEVGVALRPKID
jgi:hypothetical protein